MYRDFRWQSVSNASDEGSLDIGLEICSSDFDLILVLWLSPSACLVLLR